MLTARCSLFISQASLLSSPSSSLSLVPVLLRCSFSAWKDASWRLVCVSQFLCRRLPNIRISHSPAEFWWLMMMNGCNIWCRNRRGTRVIIRQELLNSSCAAKMILEGHLSSHRVNNDPASLCDKPGNEEQHVLSSVRIISCSPWRRIFAVKCKVIVGMHVFRAPLSQDDKKKEVLANYPRRATVQRLPIRESGTVLFSVSVTLQWLLEPTFSPARNKREEQDGTKGGATYTSLKRNKNSQCSWCTAPQLGSAVCSLRVLLPGRRESRTFWRVAETADLVYGSAAPGQTRACAVSHIPLSNPGKEDRQVSNLDTREVEMHEDAVQM